MNTVSTGINEYVINSTTSQSQHRAVSISNQSKLRQRSKIQERQTCVCVYIEFAITIPHFIRQQADCESLALVLLLLYINFSSKCIIVSECLYHGSIQTECGMF